MTLSGFFTHEHNRVQAAEQEYELAKSHHQEVLKHRDPLNPEHDQRFKDAQERLEVAREAYIRAMDQNG